MKKTMKIIVVLLVAVIAVALLSNTAFAKIALNWSAAETSIVQGTDTTGTVGAVGRIAGTIINVVQVVGMAVAVIMLIVLAIKYISAAPSDKAEIKKHAVVYVVGAIVLFAASGILEIVKNFAGMI